MSASAPRLQLAVLGLDPIEGPADGAPDRSGAIWTWPRELPAEGGLPRLMAGRFRAPAPGKMPEAAAEYDAADSNGESGNDAVDDPDAQAVAWLEGAAIPGPVDAISRALGDWRLDGGTREAFEDQRRSWIEQGFERLLAFDPVHLKPETDHAITLGPRFLDLTEVELDSLLADLNDWLGHDGMRAERIGRQVYLLARVRDDGVGPAARSLTRSLAPLACLLNRNAGVFLDEAHSEPVLRQWLTELQMWLYPQPLNDRRAGQGQAIVSSFWPHGMADLAAGLPTAVEDQATVISDSPAVLARHPSAMPWQPTPGEALTDALRNAQDVRVVLTEAAWCRLEGDLSGYQAQLLAIDAWLKAIKATAPDLAVELVDGQGGHWRPETFWSRLRRRFARGRS
ncbi:hypothetical protein P8631_07745 [Guyparkeria sp. 1SP6A2]|nr:hypothetical protein [Guyparkeria sp. 1SP6A2]